MGVRRPFLAQQRRRRIEGQPIGRPREDHAGLRVERDQREVGAGELVGERRDVVADADESGFATAIVLGRHAPVVSTTNSTLASERLIAARPPPIVGSTATITSASNPIADQRNTLRRDGASRLTHRSTRTTAATMHDGQHGERQQRIERHRRSAHPTASRAPSSGDGGDDPRRRPIVGDDLRRNVEAGCLQPTDAVDDFGCRRLGVGLEECAAGRLRRGA